VTWWHWGVLALLLYCAHYLQKIRELLGWLMLMEAHRDKSNPAAQNILEERAEQMRLQLQHPFIWRLVWWWRNS
jgi:hypothetical protein